MTWPALFVLALGTYLLRLSGFALADRLTLSPRVRAMFDIAATTLLVALAATSALIEGRGFADAARPAGVIVGVIAAWFRWPFAVAVILAAATTAGLRAMG